MKKLLTILVLSIVLMMVGCANDEPVGSITTFNSSTLETVTIENCEYFKQHGSHGERTYSHKGNCKNQIHFCDRIMQSEQKIKELEEQKRNAEEQLKLLRK